MAKKELFIVEGQSAASTLSQSLNKPSQMVLALQGKLINAEKASVKKVMSNTECQKLFSALNCGIAEQCNPERLPFSRVILLADPDVDGIHARALMLILFKRFLPALINAGIVYLIIPPLFRISSQSGTNIQYAWSQTQLDTKLSQSEHVQITRFKGIAQFTGSETQKLLLNPDSRKQIQVGYDRNT